MHVARRQYGAVEGSADRAGKHVRVVGNVALRSGVQHVEKRAEVILGDIHVDDANRPAR